MNEEHIMSPEDNDDVDSAAIAGGGQAHTDGLQAMTGLMREGRVPIAIAKRHLTLSLNFNRSNVESDPQWPFDGGDNIPWMRFASASTIEPEFVGKAANGMLAKEQDPTRAMWARGEVNSGNPYTDWRQSAEHAIFRNPRCAAAHDRLRSNMRRRLALLALCSSSGQVYVNGRLQRSGPFCRSAGQRTPVDRNAFGAGYEYLPGALGAMAAWARRPGILATYSGDHAGDYVTADEQAALLDLVTSPSSRGGLDAVRAMLGDTRIASTLVVMRFRSGAVFSGFVGPVVGHQTSPTWGVLVTGPTWQMPGAVRAEIGKPPISAVEDAFRRKVPLQAGDVKCWFPYPQGRIRGGHPLFNRRYRGFIDFDGRTGTWIYSVGESREQRACSSPLVVETPWLSAEIGQRAPIFETEL